MASGIPTRTRTRRADENAPPLTRASRSTHAITTTAKPTTTRSSSAIVPSAAAAAAKSAIPVMKRTVTATSSSSITGGAMKLRTGVLGEVTNAGKKAGALGDKTNKAREAKPLLTEKGKASASTSTSAPTAGKRSRAGVNTAPLIKTEEKPLLSKRRAATSTSTRSRSTTASTSAAEAKPLADKTDNLKEEKPSQEEPARKRRKTSSPAQAEPLGDDLVDEGQYDPDGEEVLLVSGEEKGLLLRSPKRVRAKDEGWEDLDADDEGDPTMVSEYVVDAFQYMLELEVTTMPNPDYMSDQTELQWKMRTVLMDWLIEVHAKFRLLPETLFIAVNLIDRFLSQRIISLGKFQLVGLTALFIAAKYEEVICPSVTHFLQMADGGYGVEEVLKAERYLLSALEFDLSYPNPLHFLRRISKADGYDIQTRTLGKFLMEISALDHRLMPFPPSMLAAAGMWLARLCLERGPWNANLVHYSEYAVDEIIEPAQIMLDYLLDPYLDTTTAFYKKYASKKHMKASTYMHSWATNRWRESVLGTSDEYGVELYIEAGITPPKPRLLKALNRVR